MGNFQITMGIFLSRNFGISNSTPQNPKLLPKNVTNQIQRDINNWSWFLFKKNSIPWESKIRSWSGKPSCKNFPAPQYFSKFHDKTQLIETVKKKKLLTHLEFFTNDDSPEWKKHPFNYKNNKKTGKLFSLNLKVSNQRKNYLIKPTNLINSTALRFSIPEKKLTNLGSHLIRLPKPLRLRVNQSLRKVVSLVTASNKRR